MGLDLSALDATLFAKPESQPALAALPPRAPLALFEEDPDNPRFEHDAAAFEALVVDIGRHGILQPIVVRQLENGKLRIRFGACRFRAAVRLGLADAPYVTTEDERQLDDYAQVSENARRAPLQPLELATFIAKKLALGEKKRMVAERLQMDPSALTHLLALVGDAPAWLLELYHANRCRTPQYLYALRRLDRDHPDLVAARCAQATEVDKHFLDALAVECAALAYSPATEGSAAEQGACEVDHRADTDTGNHRSASEFESGERSETDPETTAETKAETKAANAATKAGTKALVSKQSSNDQDAKAALATADASVSVTSESGSATWPKLNNPRLLALVGKHSIQIALHLRASSIDKAVVLFDDGRVDEVLLSAIHLTTLADLDA